MDSKETKHEERSHTIREDDILIYLKRRDKTRREEQRGDESKQEKKS